MEDCVEPHRNARATDGGNKLPVALSSGKSGCWSLTELPKQTAHLLRSPQLVSFHEVISPKAGGSSINGVKTKVKSMMRLYVLSTCSKKHLCSSLFFFYIFLFFFLKIIIIFKFIVENLRFKN